ncbi:MAG: MMPL family transporter [Acholeplasmatales bacterium]|nr:MMPL family transporter [Acholeplasmatales bacterium]
MRKVGNFIVKFRYALLTIFVILVTVCAILMSRVNINYDMTNYLDKDSESSVSLKIMEKEFGSSGQCQYMISGEKLTYEDAVELKDDIVKDEGVASIVFAESEADTDYFKTSDGTTYAIYKIFLTTGNYEIESYDTLDRIDDIIDEFSETHYDVKSYSTGASVENDFLTNALDKDMVIIILVVAIIVLVILTIVSTSWVEPIVFAFIVVGSILINLGTNILLNYIGYINNSMSFITKSIAAVMQLALSMDYAIVLLHTYKEMKTKTDDKKEAMAMAIAKAFAPISSSSLTTVAGLVALMFMSFSIGFDVGLVLSKGIIISLLCVFLFMPALLLIFDKLLTKTTHKSIDEVFVELREKRIKKAEANGKDAFTIAKFQKKTRIVVPVLLLVIILIGAIFNFRTDYSYVLEASTDKNATVNVDSEKITDEFGIQNTLVILIPKEKYNYEVEQEVINYLANYEYDGQKIINSSQGLTTYGVNVPRTSQEIAFAFNLNKDIVDLVYNQMVQYDNAHVEIDENGVARISPENLINFIIENDAITKYTTSKQQELDTAYASYKDKLYNADGSVNTTTLSAMKLYCETYEKYLALKETNPETAAAILSGLGMTEEEASQTYQSYASLVKVLTKEEILSSYAFVTEEMVNGLVAASVLRSEEGHESTTDIYSFELITFLSNYQVVVDEAGNTSKLLAIYAAKLNAALAEKQGEITVAYSSLSSENYYRIIFNMNMPVSGEDTFEAINDITDTLYDGQEFDSYDLKVVSESFVYSEIKDVFNRDIIVVNLISFLAILLIIAITFKSYFVPLLLTALIQGAIWITMGSSTLFGSEIFFVCYIVVMCIQMGATIDYAILLTSNYTSNRKTMNKVNAMSTALKSSLLTIVTSGSILIISTLIIGIVSRVKIISDLGFLLSKGCTISVIIVLLCLPQFLMLFDKVIEKTTFKTKFYNEAIDAEVKEYKAKEETPEVKTKEETTENNNEDKPESEDLKKDDDVIQE